MKSAEPLWKRIADDLSDEIDRGTCRAGEALPTAQQLSSRYGVNRHTVLQAYRFLASQGRVSVEQGRGTFVTAQRIPYPVGRHVSFRTNLAKSGLESSNTVLDATVTSAEFAPSIGLTPDAKVWCIRILSVAGAVPVSISTHYLPVERFPGFPERLAVHAGSISATLASYGIARYQRLNTRLHARLATAMESRLLQIEEPGSVLHSAGIDADLTGIPLQAVETAFAGDRIEVVVEPE